MPTPRTTVAAPYDVTDTASTENFVPPNEADFLGRIYFSLNYTASRWIELMVHMIHEVVSFQHLWNFTISAKMSNHSVKLNLMSSGMCNIFIYGLINKGWYGMFFACGISLHSRRSSRPAANVTCPCRLPVGYGINPYSAYSPAQKKTDFFKTSLPIFLLVNF